MRYKTWTIWFVAFVFFMNALAFLGNYIIDPFGLKSTDDKDLQNLQDTEYSYIYPVKISQKAPYYLVGSSRTKYFNLNKASNYLNNHIIRIGMSGQTLDESLFLIERIKANKNNFISGLDVFSINEYYFADRKNRLIQDFTKDDISSFFTFYLHFYTTQASLRYIRNKILSLPHNKLFIDKDSMQGKENSHQEIEHIRFLDNKKNFNRSFRFYNFDTQKILNLARLADSSDIFILFPKYAYYYKLFAKYGVQEQYFRALKLLVTNTKARVFSFYGINSITLDKDNFDDEAWHFKPKISEVILARIFNDSKVNVPSDFGVELSQDNIDKYLESMRKEVQDYNP